MRVIVCDASPLIVLAKADLLDLLKAQFASGLIPSAVVREIRAGPPNDPMRLLLDQDTWFQQVEPQAPLILLPKGDLGHGEAAVIEFARTHSNHAVLLDDYKARRIAQAMGLTVFGTLSIVARAAKAKPSSSFLGMVQRLRESGLYIHQRVVDQVQRHLERT